MGEFPKWYKGKLKYDEIDHTWYGEREGKLFKRRGLWVSKPNLDSLTDEERAKSIKSR